MRSSTTENTSFLNKIKSLFVSHKEEEEVEKTDEELREEAFDLAKKYYKQLESLLIDIEEEKRFETSLTSAKKNVKAFSKQLSILENEINELRKNNKYFDCYYEEIEIQEKRRFQKFHENAELSVNFHSSREQQEVAEGDLITQMKKRLNDYERPETVLDGVEIKNEEDLGFVMKLKGYRKAEKLHLNSIVETENEIELLVAKTKAVKTDEERIELHKIAEEKIAKLEKLSVETKKIQRSTSSKSWLDNEDDKENLSIGINEDQFSQDNLKNSVIQNIDNLVAHQNEDEAFQSRAKRKAEKLNGSSQTKKEEKENFEETMINLEDI